MALKVMNNTLEKLGFVSIALNYASKVRGEREFWISTLESKLTILIPL